MVRMLSELPKRTHLFNHVKKYQIEIFYLIVYLKIFLNFIYFMQVLFYYRKEYNILYGEDIHVLG